MKQLDDEQLKVLLDVARYNYITSDLKNKTLTIFKLSLKGLWYIHLTKLGLTEDGYLTSPNSYNYMSFLIHHGLVDTQEIPLK